MAKVSKQEYAEQLGKLREWIKPGDTVYTILEHVSRSGMSRTIKVVVPIIRRTAIYPDGYRVEIGPDVLACSDSDHGGQAEIASTVDHVHPNYAVSVVTGYPRDKGRGREGVKVGGCGMDMGFALVHSLSERLYGGEQCDCGRWFLHVDGRVFGPYADRKIALLPPEVTGQDDRPITHDDWRHAYSVDCTKCHGTGNVAGTGYLCLGKGKCPSNYHRNHRAMLRCAGVPNGPRCGRPDAHGRFAAAPEMIAAWPKINLAKGVEILAHTLFDEDGEYGREICPTCKGRGEYANPDGPERFDLGALRRVRGAAAVVVMRGPNLSSGPISHAYLLAANLHRAAWDHKVHCAENCTVSLTRIADAARVCMNEGPRAGITPERRAAEIADFRLWEWPR